MSLLLAAVILLQDEKISKVMSDLPRFRVALGAYEVDNGRYPTTKQGLAALLRRPEGAKNWRGPYLEVKEIPLDAWGNA
jgi:general secretion pathway protein G